MRCMLLALLFAQIGPASAAGALPDYVVHGGTVALVLWLWKQDRGDRAKEQQAREKQYASLAAQYTSLAEDFRRIVQDNTAALVSLRDAITGNGRGEALDRAGVRRF